MQNASRTSELCHPPVENFLKLVKWISMVDWRPTTTFRPYPSIQAFSSGKGNSKIRHCPYCGGAPMADTNWLIVVQVYAGVFSHAQDADWVARANHFAEFLLSAANLAFGILTCKKPQPRQRTGFAIRYMGGSLSTDFSLVEVRAISALSRTGFPDAHTLQTITHLQIKLALQGSELPLKVCNWVG